MTRLTLRLTLALTGILSVGACRGWESPLPPVHLNPNMDTQEKGKAYRSSDFFKDGRMMRTPPVGTVARGYLHEDDARSFGREANGDPVSAFPGGHASWESSLARGQRQYTIYCAPCHGTGADGKGPVAPKMAVPPPSFLDDRLKNMTVGQIYQAETYGVNAGNMGSYAAQLSETDRWAVAYYVRTLQCPDMGSGGRAPGCMEKAYVAAPKIDPNAQPTAAIGEQLFTTKGGCNACHTVDGTPRVGPTMKGLWGKSENTSAGTVTVDEAYIIESIRNPNAKVVNGFPPAMPPRTDLSETEVKSLVLYIQSLGATP